VTDGFREAVASEAGAELAKLVEGSRVNGCHTTADACKRVPRPWAADHPRGELLELKGLVVGWQAPPPPELGRADFVDWCIAAFGRPAPVHHWMRRALGQARSDRPQSPDPVCPGRPPAA
jgi:hypothetical protein